MARKPYLSEELHGYQDEIIDLNVRRSLLSADVALDRLKINAIDARIAELTAIIKTKRRKSYF